MPELIDLYFWVDRRDAEFVETFLDHYLSEREPTRDYYLITTNDVEEEIEAKDVAFVLSFYEHHITSEYCFYFTNRDEQSLITTGIINYTNDGKMIFGVSVIRTISNRREIMLIFNDMNSFLNSSISCMTVEEPPPDNSVKFIAFAKQRADIFKFI